MLGKRPVLIFTTTPPKPRRSISFDLKSGQMILKTSFNSRSVYTIFQISSSFIIRCNTDAQSYTISTKEALEQPRD